MKINEIIQGRRKELKMTQRQMAELLDVSDKVISRWELGITYPNVDMIPKIANVLGISINELFGSNSNDEVNLKEKRNYDKIASFTISSIQFMIVSILSIVLFVIGEREKSGIRNDNIATILISCSFAFAIISLIFFIAYRTRYTYFYRDKFFQEEYKNYDAKYTSLVIICSSMLLQIFCFRDLPLAGIPILPILSIVLAFSYMKRLGYKPKYRPFWSSTIIVLLLAVVIYSVFQVTSIADFALLSIRQGSQPQPTEDIIFFYILLINIIIGYRITLECNHH